MAWKMVPDSSAASFALRSREPEQKAKPSKAWAEEVLRRHQQKLRQREEERRCKASEALAFSENALRERVSHQRSVDVRQKGAKRRSPESLWDLWLAIRFFRCPTFQHRRT